MDAAALGVLLVCGGILAAAIAIYARLFRGDDFWEHSTGTIGALGVILCVFIPLAFFHGYHDLWPVVGIVLLFAALYTYPKSRPHMFPLRRPKKP
jgi:uncharacterized membrane protein HdeD (DUF308 family)